MKRSPRRPVFSPHRRLGYQVGRRGAILLILSVIDVSYGASLISPPADSLTTAAIQWRQHYAPMFVWGVCWLVIGMVLIVSAFRRADAVGYSAAIGWKIVWALTTLASWIFGNVERGWVAAIIWGTFAGMVWVISGWPEPPSNKGNPHDPARR